MGDAISCGCAADPCSRAVDCNANCKDSCGVAPLGASALAPWAQTDDLDVTLMAQEELNIKLQQVAFAEECQHHALYAATLTRVLGLLAGTLVNVPGSAALVVVAPEREIEGLELDYADEGELTTELAGVNVKDPSFEKSLSSCSWLYAGVVDHEGRPTESAFFVSLETGRVVAALAYVPAALMSASTNMTAVDIANSLTRGVVFTRSKQGIVSVYPSVEVQWSRAYEVSASARKGAGGGAPELAVMLDNLGNGHLQNGDPAEAKRLHERALTIQEAHFGPNHAQVAVTLDNLGIAQAELGNPEASKEHLQRSLKITEAQFGKDHVQVAYTLENLGRALRDCGDLHQAQGLHERALRIYEAEYGPESVRLGRTLHSLGHVQRGLGKPAKARAYYQRALVVYKNDTEQDQTQLAICYNNLGNAARELGDVQGARKLYEMAMKIAEASFGSSHNELGSTLNNLGLAHLELGVPETAHSLFERALDIFEANHGPRHTFAAMVRTNMATCMAVLGHNKQAKECVVRAEMACDAIGGTMFSELELRVAAVRFAVGDKVHPTPQERWNKAEGQIEDLLGPEGLDAVCARCKEGLIRSWQHTGRTDVITWLQSRGTARI